MDGGVGVADGKQQDHQDLGSSKGFTGELSRTAECGLSDQIGQRSRMCRDPRAACSYSRI